VAVSAVSKRARVLIAEDRAPLSVRLSEIVGRAGFQAVVVYSGQVALSQTRALQPDLVVLSDHIGPPGASETARRIKEDPTTADIPIIILTEGERQAQRAAYPVEACLPFETDEDKLGNVIRLLAGGASRRARSFEPSLGPLEGNLQGSPLTDILQFLFVTRKTGRVSITDGDRRGAIYFDSGTVLHAELGDARGVDAFFALCVLGRGQFKFDPAFKPREATMNESGVELVLEAARRWDTWRQSRESGAEGEVAPAGRANDPTPRSDPNDPTRVAPIFDASNAGPRRIERRRVPRPETPAAPAEPPQARQRSELDVRLVTHRGSVLALALVALASAFMIGRFFPLDDPGSVTVPGPYRLPWEENRFPISVASTPAGARVLVDGHDVGLTPVTELMLGAGRYVIRVEHDGYKAVQTQVPVGAESASRELSYALEPEVPSELGTLVLRVVPAGAALFVNGVKLAPSPGPLQLAPGNYKIEAHVTGFDSLSENVEVAPRGSHELEMTLKRSKSPVSAPAPPLPAAKAAEEAPAPAPAEPPQKVAGNYPSYPVAQKRTGRRLSGTVAVEIEVDEEGNVASTRLVESAGAELDEAVLKALTTWKYRPAMRDGKPVRAFVPYRHMFNP